MTYAIMRNPRHGRVYFDGAVPEVRSLRAEVRFEDIREADIAGVPYVLFDTKEALTAQDIRLLSRISFAYAIFELRGELLLPIKRDCGYFIDEDISGILKYSGKTNELFTRLMLNLSLAHGKGTGPVRILDPMAGKGTTLFEGLMLGADVYGIEIDPKPAYEAFVYVKKHFEMAKYKHTSHTEKTSGVGADGKKFTATRYQVEMARTKEEQKAGKSCRFEIIAGDTRNVSAFYKKEFFNAIITDLPYGVQHGAKKKPHSNGNITRNALELVSEAMPGWVKVLKPGGTVALAWNLFLISREEMVKLFAANGLMVQDGQDFSHRLDQATHRDLIIGVNYTVKSGAL